MKGKGRIRGLAGLALTPAARAGRSSLPVWCPLDPRLVPRRPRRETVIGGGRAVIERERESREAVIEPEPRPAQRRARLRGQPGGGAASEAVHFIDRQSATLRDSARRGLEDAARGKGDVAADQGTR